MPKYVITIDGEAGELFASAIKLTNRYMPSFDTERAGRALVYGGLKNAAQNIGDKEFQARVEQFAVSATGVKTEEVHAAA